MTSPPSITTAGDRALLVRFSARPSKSLTGILSALSRAARSIEGVIDAAPGYRTVLVEVEPGSRDEIARHLPDLVGEVQPEVGQRHKVAVRYDGEDLDWVCTATDISRGELVEIHSARTYDVRMVGSPGFIYLSAVARRIAVPRMDDPRTLVAEGSVGIGGTQTGIYGKARPGGWRLIGTVLEVPAVAPGDRVRFVPE